MMEPPSTRIAELLPVIINTIRIIANAAPAQYFMAFFVNAAANPVFFSIILSMILIFYCSKYDTPL